MVFRLLNRSEGPITILVVDDEASLRGLLKRVLVQAGFQVVEAMNGEEGLLRAREIKGSFGLVISDVHMPILDGPAFARAFRPLHPDVPILFITGRESHDPDFVAAVGANGELLRKPFGPDALLGAVERLVASAPGVGRASA